MPATPVGRYGLCCTVRATCTRFGFGRRLVSVRTRRALARRAVARRTGAAGRGSACWTPARPEARRHTCWRSPTADVTALDVDPVRCERIGDTLRRWAAGEGCRRRCGAAIDLVGRRAVRRDPAGRTVHRLGIVRRPPRCALAAPRNRHCAAGRAAGPVADALGRSSPRGGGCCIAPVRWFRAEGETPDANVCCTQQRRSFAAGAWPFLPQSGATAMASRDNPESDHDGFSTMLEKKSAPCLASSATGLSGRRGCGFAARCWRLGLAGAGPIPRRRDHQFSSNAAKRACCCRPRCASISRR